MEKVRNKETEKEGENNRERERKREKRGWESFLQRNIHIYGNIQTLCLKLINLTFFFHLRRLQKFTEI